MRVEIICNNTACICGDSTLAICDIRHATVQELAYYLFLEGQ